MFDNQALLAGKPNTAHQHIEPAEAVWPEGLCIGECEHAATDVRAHVVEVGMQRVRAAAEVQGVRVVEPRLILELFRHLAQQPNQATTS